MENCALAGKHHGVLFPHCAFLHGLTNHHAAMLHKYCQKESLLEKMLGGPLCIPPPQPTVLLFKDKWLSNTSPKLTSHLLQLGLHQRSGAPPQW